MVYKCKEGKFTCRYRKGKVTQRLCGCKTGDKIDFKEVTTYKKGKKISRRI